MAARGGDSARNLGSRLLRTETVEGEPYLVGDRSLTPVVRVRAIGPSGGRWGLRWIEPVALVEAAGGVTRRMAIPRPGPAAGAMAAMLVVPILVYLLGRALFGRR